MFHLPIPLQIQCVQVVHSFDSFDHPDPQINDTFVVGPWNKIEYLRGLVIHCPIGGPQELVDWYFAFEYQRSQSFVEVGRRGDA